MKHVCGKCGGELRQSTRSNWGVADGMPVVECVRCGYWVPGVLSKKVATAESGTTEEIAKPVETVGYMVMRLRKWDGFEPAPGSWVPFPVSIKPEGIGFCIVYGDYDEAKTEAGGADIFQIKFRRAAEEPE